MCEWMWKLLCACDGLLLSESSASVEGSRRNAISERTGWVEEGQRGALKAMAEAQGRKRADTRD
eukprot:7318854-Lingulodinium_polyedra.AAC.1